MRKIIVIDDITETVKVAIHTGGRTYQGEAKCNWMDNFNEDLGIALATARAELPLLLSELGRCGENLELPYMKKSPFMTYAYIEELTNKVSEHLYIIDSMSKE